MAGTKTGKGCTRRAHPQVVGLAALALAWAGACGSDVGGQPTPADGGAGELSEVRLADILEGADLAEAAAGGPWDNSGDAEPRETGVEGQPSLADGPAADAPTAIDEPSVDVASSCPELAGFAGTSLNAASAVQTCIDRTPPGGALALPPGRYLVGRQIVLGSPLHLGTAGKLDADPACDADNLAGDCFELVASADFLIDDPDQPGILWLPPAAAGTSLDHLIVNGNNLARLASEAAARCTGGGLPDQMQNTYGYNVTIAADDVRVQGVVSRDALCGTGMEVDGKYGITIVNNRFVSNGVHDRFALWADGLTVTDAAGALISDNLCVDNSDVDLIVGGCAGCRIWNNQVRHGDRYESSSFAAMMLTVWAPPSVPSSTGDFTGADIAGNQIDCGAGKRCAFGLNLGVDAWLATGPLFGGDVHDNVIRNARQGLNVSHTTGSMHLYDNQVSDSGGDFTTSCGPRTLSAYNISPTSTVDRTGDDVPDAAYTHMDFTGCMPDLL
jgi:hypothetical protein